MPTKIEKVKEMFINEWGALGTAWGINKTVAQVHATLMAEMEPIHTDELMEKLSISRGNAHSSLKELVAWGIIKKVVKKGVRKEFFLAEKDPWKILCAIAKERRKREIEPTLTILMHCLEELKNSKENGADDFVKLLQELQEFISMGDRLLEKLGNSEKSLMMKMLVKLL
jgi:DNA-binding transcriptional regulator GbsR (MarR family)